MEIYVTLNEDNNIEIQFDKDLYTWLEVAKILLDAGNIALLASAGNKK
jgi:hypothetical protein